MQRKNTKKIVSLLLLATIGTTVLVGCNSDKKIAFSPLWQENASIASKPNAVERLTYKVSFEKSTGMNFNYSVDYPNAGTYTAELASYADENGSVYYKYTTQLDISVVYECNGEKSELFNDIVLSEVTFKTANEGLQPLKSRKEIKSHSPVSNAAATVEDSYVYYETTTEIDYTTGKAKTVTSMPEGVAEGETIPATTNEYSVKKNESYTNIDNEQLFVALRGIDPTTVVGAPTLAVYSPYVDRAQLVTAQSGSKTTEKRNFTLNGAELDKEISYYPVTIALNDKNPGMSQTLEIAATTSSTKNEYRNVVLRYQVPLSLNLGVLTYELTSATFM